MAILFESLENPINDWLRDSNGNEIIKTLVTDSTSVSFSEDELAEVIDNNYAIGDAYIECQETYAAPTLKNMVIDSSSSSSYLTIEYSKVTADQAGLNDDQCRLKLWIIKR